MSVTLLVGTRKGLFQLHSDDRRSWQLEGPTLEGWDVLHAIVDDRDGTLYTAANTYPYGGTVQRSPDMGKTWERAEEIGLPEETGLTLEKTWHVRPGHEPGEALARRGARARCFAPRTAARRSRRSTSLTQHETRDRWKPGAGGMCCHSIQLDADDPEPDVRRDLRRWRVPHGRRRRVLDADQQERRRRLHARRSTPRSASASTSCSRIPAKTERLWQQNHCGVYRSDDRGDTGSGSTATACPASFGFPIMLHPRDPDTAWVIPEQGRPEPRHGGRAASASTARATPARSGS